jgi:hypothetical protein
VQVAETLVEAKKMLKLLQAPLPALQTIRRAVVHRDLNDIPSLVLRKRAVVNAQRFVSGRDANATVACWNGRILAGISVSVLERMEFNGPATVVQIIDNPEIANAAAAIVQQLKLTGLFGFDFILQRETGEPYLIEMNPRATQIGHLSLGVDRDLPAAIRAALTGERVSARPRQTDQEVIALFPQEWLRNPASPFLRTAYHDVPWDEPDLIRSCIAELPRRVRRSTAPIGAARARSHEAPVMSR